VDIDQDADVFDARQDAENLLGLCLDRLRNRGLIRGSASCTVMALPSTWIPFTKPNETMSRLKPGYLTAFNASLISASEIAMSV
jgi:hypothetical protein